MKFNLNSKSNHIWTGASLYYLITCLFSKSSHYTDSLLKWGERLDIVQKFSHLYTLVLQMCALLLMLVKFRIFHSNKGSSKVKTSPRYALTWTILIYPLRYVPSFQYLVQVLANIFKSQIFCQAIKYMKKFKLNQTRFFLKRSHWFFKGCTKFLVSSTSINSDI